MSLTRDELKAHLAEVLVEWHAITGEQPWLSMPAEARIDHLPELIRDLIDASLGDPVDEAARLRTLTAAARHGEDRRIHGFPDGLIFIEYVLLREALWRFIRQFAPPEEAGPAIMRMDSDMTVASRAALFGYHARELDERGRTMPELLAELDRQWPAEIDRPALDERE